MTNEQIDLIESAVSSEWGALHNLDREVGAYYRAAISVDYYGLVETKVAESYAHQLEVLVLGRELNNERNKKEGR